MCSLRSRFFPRGAAQEYPNGTVGLRGLDLDLYENQISALLGHNGAGKVLCWHWVFSLS